MEEEGYKGYNFVFDMKKESVMVLLVEDEDDTVIYWQLCALITVSA